MAGEPTLRQGDHIKDGWVAYAQGQLSSRGETYVEPDGYFGESTEAAVKAFQAANHLHADGVIGDQTWAALTAAEPPPAGTHGHEHHSDHGQHVVWSYQGGEDDGFYRADTDDIMWLANVVGDKPVKSNEYMATVELTVNGERHMEFFYLASLNGAAEAKPGESMEGNVTGVKASYGSGTHSYTVQMPEELGNGIRHGEFTVP